MSALATASASTVAQSSTHHTQHDATRDAIITDAAAAHMTRCSTMNRREVIPDNRDAAATDRASVQHVGLCDHAEDEPCTGMSPRVDPIFVLTMDALLNHLVDLIEPTCRRCIQLRQQSNNWNGSSGKDESDNAQSTMSGTREGAGVTRGRRPVTAS